MGMMFHPSTPYNELPPIPGPEVLESTRTLKAAIAAHRELAELKAAGHSIPDQTVLLRSMLLQEARASSEIENIVTTNDQLYRALAGSAESSDPHTREVIRYGDALWKGYADYKKGYPIRPTLLTELVQIIKGADISIRSDDGCRIVNDRSGQVVYTPPIGAERIGKMLHELCRYINEERQVDPLIKMAAAHYQFEAIHPYPDGNGRVGRVLNVLVLLHAKLLEAPVLYLSWSIVRKKSQYYSLLRNVTESGDWESWIEFMMVAVLETATITLDRLRWVHEEISVSASIARQELGRAFNRDLLDAVFAQPYTRISRVAEKCGLHRNTVAQQLRRLESIGILASVRTGRDLLYLNRRLMAAMLPDEFEQVP